MLVCVSIRENLSCGHNFYLRARPALRYNSSDMSTVPSPPYASARVKLRPQITLAPLIGILYFTVSGGAYGLEDLVQATGPGLALLLLLLTPLIWSLPVALMVAELSSAIPEEGGYYRWVTRGLGRFWGFQEAWWIWMWTFVDMAIYPALFAEYLKAFWPSISPLQQWGIALLVIWSAAGLNARGAKTVGMGALFSLGLVLLPFLFLTAFGLARMDHAPWSPLLTSSKSWPVTLGLGLSVVMWNYQGWDNISAFSGEVVRPAWTFPRALAFTLPLVVLSYLLPVLAGLGATSEPSLWTTAYFPELARRVSGPILAGWIGLSALVSQWCLFNSQLLFVSRLPFVLAEDRYLPKALAWLHPHWHTPCASILLCAVVYSGLTWLNFKKLVVLDVCIYSIALVLELIALVRLRQREPDLPRPFKIPGGRWGLSFVCGMPILLILTNLTAVLLSPDTLRRDLLLTLLAVLSGPLVYFVTRRVRQRTS